MEWFEAVRDRVVPATGDVALTAPRLLVVLGVALVLVAVGPLWRVVRLAVTLVHELGHAVVGVLVGRQFTGFVLRGDMSGHAVTRGPVRGAGRVASTWAGYPMPALLGAAMVWAAERGWSAPLITAGLAILLFALIRVRSVLTVVVMVVVTRRLGRPVVVAGRRAAGRRCSSGSGSCSSSGRGATCPRCSVTAAAAATPASSRR